MKLKRVETNNKNAKNIQYCLTGHENESLLRFKLNLAFDSNKNDTGSTEDSIVVCTISRSESDGNGNVSTGWCTTSCLAIIAGKVAELWQDDDVVVQAGNKSFVRSEKSWNECIFNWSLSVEKVQLELSV